MRTNHSRLMKDAGFSLVELLVVIGILGTAMGMAALVTRNTLGMSKADSAAKELEGALREAREAAIASRRNIEVQFIAPNVVTWGRREVNGSVETGVVTELGRVTMEYGVQFVKLPSDVPDSPDAFGKAAAIDFGDAKTLLFTSEGTFVDETGEPRNGSAFIGIPGDLTSLHGVTIFGPTALVHRYAVANKQWAD